MSDKYYENYFRGLGNIRRLQDQTTEKRVQLLVAEGLSNEDATTLVFLDNLENTIQFGDPFKELSPPEKRDRLRIMAKLETLRFEKKGLTSVEAKRLAELNFMFNKGIKLQKKELEEREELLKKIPSQEA